MRGRERALESPAGIVPPDRRETFADRVSRVQPTKRLAPRPSGSALLVAFMQGRVECFDARTPVVTAQRRYRIDHARGTFGVRSRRRDAERAKGALHLFGEVFVVIFSFPYRRCYYRPGS